MDMILSPRFNEDNFQRQQDVIKISLISKSSCKKAFKKSLTPGRNIKLSQKNIQLPQINLSLVIDNKNMRHDLSEKLNRRINKRFINRNALRFTRSFIHPLPYLQVLNYCYQKVSNKEGINRIKGKLIPIKAKSEV